MIQQGGGQRSWLPFRAVNRRDQAGYDPGVQRHHLLPRQLLRREGTAVLFRALGRDRLRFDDFRQNGLLLPATDRSALRIGLPLHRGPHRSYNELVSERVGQIEASWARSRAQTPKAALTDALARLELLQRALRRRLLDQRRRLLLSRKDPLGSGVDFTELDALVDDLWPATAVDGP
ncbi:MAG: AHH domain-containing protein [Novosphingobium sp.]|uniref:AHH domain-containing protein n=1 Tax=Novosphingobium sp. TaxID=1874826 RepID=UPI003919E82E|nr:AHH domain-containing protein [Novosphingobium sp.]